MLWTSFEVFDCEPKTLSSLIVDLCKELWLPVLFTGHSPTKPKGLLVSVYRAQALAAGSSVFLCQKDEVN